MPYLLCVCTNGMEVCLMWNMYVYICGASAAGLILANSMLILFVYIKCKKHFTKMLKDVGMVVPKIKGRR